MKWFASIAFLGLSSLFVATPSVAAEPKTESKSDSEWTVLFDGKSTDHWRNYKKDKVSDGWKVEDGALVRKEKGAGDLISKEQYGAFELSIEYKISPEGNSGIMFHVQETDGAPYFTGPEIQVQDNQAGHDPQLAGWLYQLYKPKKVGSGDDAKILDATKSAGEWNHLLIRIDPAGSSVSMNGQKYYDFVVGSEDWNQRFANSKFKDANNFAESESNIQFQDHGADVSYRHILIREL